MITYKFVKKFSGMVLYIKNRYPGYFPGDWEYKWEKATDTQAFEILCKINKEEQ